MRIPLIIIRDEDGQEHVVGENPHDVLYVDENGALQYANSHCGEGTKHGTYTFVGVTAKDDEYSVTGKPEIEFVTINRLIDMESERLKRRLKVALTGRDTSAAEAGTVSETHADDAIHPFVCPVSEEVFCTVSPEVFQLLMNRALAKIIHMNKKGYLRLMLKANKDCGKLYEFVQRVFSTGEWEDCVINYEPVNPRQLYDPSPKGQQLFSLRFPLLTEIIIKRNTNLANKMAHEKSDRVIFAREIKKLMQEHFYSKEEQEQLEDAFILANNLKREEEKKAWEKDIEKRLDAMKKEGEALSRKYGIRFEYHYAPTVSIRRGEEIMNRNFAEGPSYSYISQIIQDEKYRSRKAEYERIAALINEKAGKRVHSSCYVKRRLFNDFIRDSGLTRNSNPDKRLVAYIDKDNGDIKKELLHWTLIDVACCNETLFASVIEAMREYIKEKGLNVTLP